MILPTRTRALLVFVLAPWIVGCESTRGAAALLNPDYDPVRILVHWESGFSEAERAQVRTIVGGTTDRAYATDFLPDLELLEVDLTLVSIEKAAELVDEEDVVRYAELNYYVRPLDEPDDEYFSRQWNMVNTGQIVGGHAGAPDADVGAAGGWAVSTGAQSNIIAVIDTGIDLTHRDLLSNLWRNEAEVVDGIDNDANGRVDDVQGYDFYSDDADPADPEGHGTHVAGIIGAVGDNGIGVAGVNWACRLMPLRFMGNGRGLVSDAISALQYAVEKGVRVSCNSWGDDDYSQALEDAIVRVGEKGMVFVTSAGNRHSNNDRVPVYPASLPLRNLITVASVDHRDRLGAKSNWGEASVHVGAPGVYVLSTSNDGEYQIQSGTSMAAAHVAGVVALVTLKDPGMSPQEIRDHVLETARPVSALAGRIRSGGVVDLGHALE